MLCPRLSSAAPLSEQVEHHKHLLRLHLFSWSSLLAQEWGKLDFRDRKSTGSRPTTTSTNKAILPGEADRGKTLARGIRSPYPRHPGAAKDGIHALHIPSAFVARWSLLFHGVIGAQTDMEDTMHIDRELEAYREAVRQLRRNSSVGGGK